MIKTPCPPPILSVPALYLTYIRTYVHTERLYKACTRVIISASAPMESYRSYVHRCTHKYSVKKRMYWVIASVLGLYWAREALSMVFSTQYVSHSTANMIKVNTISLCVYMSICLSPINDRLSHSEALHCVVLLTCVCVLCTSTCRPLDAM